MTPGSTAVAHDDDDRGNPMYHALAISHIEAIRRHVDLLHVEELAYLNPAELDPSNLGEIEHAVRELRRICGAAAADQDTAAHEAAR